MKVLPWWEEYKLGLTHISRLLKKHHSRQRLYEACLSPDAIAYIGANVDLQKLSVYEPRWASIAEARGEVAKLEAILRGQWDLSKYNHDEQDNQRPGDVGEVADYNIRDRFSNNPQILGLS